jgi:hypothetical protein
VFQPSKLSHSNHADLSPTHISPFCLQLTLVPSSSLLNSNRSDRWECQRHTEFTDQRGRRVQGPKPRCSWIWGAVLQIVSLELIYSVNPNGSSLPLYPYLIKYQLFALQSKWLWLVVSKRPSPRSSVMANFFPNVLCGRLVGHFAFRPASDFLGAAERSVLPRMIDFILLVYDVGFSVMEPCVHYRTLARRSSQDSTEACSSYG